MQITRTGRHYPNRSWAAWRDDAVLQIMAQGPISILKTPAKATVRYRAGDLRCRDVPGLMDALWHVLERSGVVADDALLEEVHWYTALDRDNPGATLEIEQRLEGK